MTQSGWETSGLGLEPGSHLPTAQVPAGSASALPAQAQVSEPRFWVVSGPQPGLLHRLGLGERVFSAQGPCEAAVVLLPESGDSVSVVRHVAI